MIYPFYGTQENREKQLFSIWEKIIQEESCGGAL